MKQLYEDVWQSARYNTGILNTHAYLLIRPSGNVLFYNTGFASDLEKISALGGIAYQLLTHRDEVGESLKRIKQLFSNKLAIGKLEVPYAEKHSAVDIVLGIEDTQLEDIQVYFTPGHTNGSVCYFYKSLHGKSYLFSGDTLFKWNGKWSTFVIEGFGGTNQDIIESLKKLRKLCPDVVMSSGFVGNMSHVEVTNEEWISAIDQHINKHQAVIRGSV